MRGRLRAPPHRVPAQLHERIRSREPVIGTIVSLVTHYISRVRQMLWLTIVVALGVGYLALDTTVHRSIVILIAWSIALLAIRGPIRPWAAVIAMAILGVAAVADVPHGTDLWFYQSYGRIIEEYHSNPYVVVPASITGDPVIARTVDFYRDSGSVYGPVFVLGAAAVSRLSGTGELAGRLAWQGAALVAAIGVMVLLRRRAVPWDRMALVGASPVFVYLLVNQAHNDVFVALLILGGCCLATRDREVPAGLLFALAALVKAPSGIALVTYLVWLAARGERRACMRSAAAATTLGLCVTAPFGIRAVMGPLTRDSGTTNATSLWNFLRGDVLSFLWRPERSIEPTAGSLVSILGVLVPVAIAVVAAWRLRMRPVHEPLTVALLAWVVFSLYPSVWLAGWFVALSGLWGARECRLLVGYSSLLLVTSQSWLMPVAAIVDRGTYGLVERSAALLLGVSTIAGVLLVGRLLFPKQHSPEDGLLTASR